MERNWLIRTTQNQILGPVAKTKLLEFLQKGALGLNDEVSSGNGYWFSLKEKDLVEKYLNGDIPQGYNPISESKSVLSKRENPERTTSINTAPANKTQILKMENKGPAVLPTNSDLEYPDVTLIRTTTAQISSSEEIKLPTVDDLEFPNIAEAPSSTKPPIKPIEVKQKPIEDEPVIYPEADDLAYPDMITEKNTIIDDIKPKEEQEEQEEKVEKEEIENQIEEDLGLTLIMKPSEKKKIEKPESVINALNRDRLHDRVIPAEDKKLLHERKVKISSAQVQKEITKDLPKEPLPRTMPEHLKKRNDNYLMYILFILVLVILSLFFYYYRNILNKPLPV